MAPSSWADCTTTGWETDTWDTTSSGTVDVHSTCTYTVYNSNPVARETEEDIKKRKALIKKAVIQAMKDQWSELKKEFKPVPKVRPAAQLRGVCFSGRGWA